MTWRDHLTPGELAHVALATNALTDPKNEWLARLVLDLAELLGRERMVKAPRSVLLESLNMDPIE